MRIHWMALGGGILLGAALGWYMGQQGSGGNPGISGGFAAPFQAKITTRS